MTYIKTLSLAALAAAALMALSASIASATTLTGVGGATLKAGSEIHATPGTFGLEPELLSKVECETNTTKLKTQNAGGNNLEVFSSLEQFKPEMCKEGNIVTFTKGELIVKGTGSNNGELLSVGLELTLEEFGFHCVFKTEKATKIGTITGSANTKSTATINLAGTIKRTGGRSTTFCGDNGTLSGTFQIATPDTLNIDM